MRKKELLDKISTLRLKFLRSAGPHNAVLDKFDELVTAVDKSPELFRSTLDGGYDALIADKFDINRLSTKRVTASQLCDIVGLEQNPRNQMGIARALRTATGAKSFRSNGVIYNPLPFYKDGSIETVNYNE